MSSGTSNEKLADAVDLSHHLSDLARRRKVSPLKGMQKYLQQIKPGAIQLAGGMPDPSYFPFASIGGEAMVSDSFKTDSSSASSGGLSWFWNLFSAGKDKTETLTIPRFPASPGDICLAESLQYGPATGIALLQKFINDFVRVAFPPAYSNWQTLVHVGNTDGWSRCVQTFCNPGDVILTEEWTYASAIAQVEPYQVKPVAVAMDAEGMSSEALEDLLSNWDEAVRGAKRPRLMYTVPIGQNPCGMTMGIQRKKEIYTICVKYDVLIVEDDPYYFLQEGVYIPKSERNAAPTPSVSTENFLKSLAPSFITIDYQGRVIRLDTFSKTIAPGSRMGFFTCNPQFSERLERQGETSVQRPCGFGQALIGQLLVKQWGLDEYVRWLHGLQAQYTWRRDAIVDALLEDFDTSFSYTDESFYVKGLPLYSCFAKGRSLGKQLGRIASFVPPSSGMFVWVTVHFDALPPVSEDPDLPADHEMRLWMRLAKAGVVVAPGGYFASTPEMKKPDEGHYRLAFSMGTQEALKKGAAIFVAELYGYFQDALRS